jgi:hypothetical protein
MAAGVRVEVEGFGISDVSVAGMSSITVAIVSLREAGEKYGSGCKAKAATF